MLNPTFEQDAFFNAVASISPLCVLVDAVAGSGKTTTIVHALTRIPHDPTISFLPPSVAFLAFNKQIAETLRTRCPRHVSCTTFHSLGLNALRRSGVLPKDFKVDGGKTRKLVYNAVGVNNPDVQNIVKLISLLKSALDAPIDTLLRHYDLVFEDVRTATRVATRILADAAKDLRTIDFDDMLYLPVLLNVSFDSFDYVFVDEYQDTNDIQLEILHRLRAPAVLQDVVVNEPRPHYQQQIVSPTRFFFVGDIRQAIYGFRGANADSKKKILDRFGCVEMPLSVSFRCSKAVVAEARKFLTEGFPK